MNWEIAKRWLVILFLVLDGLLAWQLESSRQLLNGYVESRSDLLANTKTLLASHGLTLTVEIPTKQPQLTSFQASLGTPPLAAVAKAVFPHETNLQFNADKTQVSSNKGQISLLSNGSFEITFAQPQPTGPNHSPKSYAYQPDNYTVDSVTSTTKQMVFLQVYKNYPIFDSEIVTQQTKNNLTSLTETEISSIQPTNAPRPVISALDALDSLANAVDKSAHRKDNKILKVDIGYARKVQLYQVGNTANYWFPVWRVVTQQQTYYVNAFTGEVEIAP